MPRRKTADKYLPRKARTRTGCNTCRQRKVKCDEQRPACSQCHKQGLPCSRGIVLKWQTDFLNRGIAFGRQGIWKKIESGESISGNDKLPSDCSIAATSWSPLPYIHTHHFVNSHQLDGKGNDVDDTKYRPAALEEWNDPLILSMPTSTTSSQAPQSAHLYTAAVKSALQYGVPRELLSALPRFQNLKFDPSALLQHFVQRLCPSTTPNESSNSPFATIILPFSFSASPAVFQSLLALSACFRCTRDQSWFKTAITLKAGALEFLRNQLASQNATEIARDAEVLIITMIMCLYEIINRCDERWVVYLRGARDIIRIRRQLPPNTTNAAVLEPVFLFAERFFAYQDVIGRTACGVDPIFNSAYWRMTGHSIDTWMGCSPELVEILCSITELYREKQNGTSEYSDPAFIIQAAYLEQRLEGLVQTVNDARDSMLSQPAEVKRLAACLYFYCTIYDASPSTKIVKSLVRDILTKATACLEAKLGASLTWPLFIAAVELDPIRDEIVLQSGSVRSGRRWVLDIIAGMSTSTVANLARMRAVIAQVWQSRDEAIGSELTLNSVTTSMLKDWETHVSPFSMYLSLV